MKNVLPNYLYATALVLFTTLSGNAFSEQEIKKMDIHSGHFSREANNGPTAKKTNNNIYIKLYSNNWIALLYVPYPYGIKVSPNTIDKVYEKVKLGSEDGSFTRSKFGLLDEAATVHLEKYEIVEGQIQFQCGSMNPCAIRLYDDENYLELIKSGIINEHIIKFDHITE